MMPVGINAIQIVGADNLLELPEEQVADNDSSNNVDTTEADPVLYFD